VSPHTLIVTV